MKLRSEIKQQAKTNFLAHYGMCIGTLIIVGLVAGFVSWLGSMFSFAAGFSSMMFMRPAFGLFGLFSLLPAAIAVFALSPLYVGYDFFNLKVYRGEKPDLGIVFTEGFKNYWRKVGGMAWMGLFTFLWMLLFVIPGIIKALAYFMTPYILADSNNVKATDALKLSMRMTAGHKGKIFVMILSFIGWCILTGLTGGILGIFYTGPYIYTSFAGMYAELKQNALEKGIVTAEELA